MNSKWLTINNSVAIPRRQIPVLHLSDLMEGIAAQIQQGLRVIQFFGYEAANGNISVVAVLSDDISNHLTVATAQTERGGRYDSISNTVLTMQLFERNLYEQFGVVPEGHPWLKPVRYGYGATVRSEIADYPFYKSTGGEVHETALGPVHGGITESGHFRFLCHGEDVFHLEIQAGYQHRGVEALFTTGNPMNKSALAESIAGDTVIGHVWAHALAIEAMSGVRVSARAEIIRAIALELERIAMHLSGLSGMSLDIGFLPGASTYGRLRNTIMDTMLMISGCRFGRGLIRPGGVLSDIEVKSREHVLRIFDGVSRDLEIINVYFFNDPGVQSLIEYMGTVSTEAAWRAGIIGIAAKSSGLPIDARADQPYGVYVKDSIEPVLLKAGDVAARARIRVLEINQSIELLRRWLNLGIMTGGIKEEARLMKADSFVVTTVEGWRGAVTHTAMTGRNSELEHYRVTDPSFHNWIALTLAMRGNGISDFPLCNRSFDLSFSAHDL
ncbi:MAG: NADH-quinone oxidoreductase subunit C [Nitrospirae bacterium]|nr:NADH-quinone oxidoreductase subunit C [Nitrospirota bacterium]MBF0535286.1 NADH-quinone oxidoreductase subunit C [Nitrospirota bacterium]MBF0617291.1 NADH-quinone oxidoreductase subunit C [Nitrospirota bacterium]